MSRAYDPYDVFSFEGRIRRRDWWLTCLLVNFTASMLSFIGAMVLPNMALIVWVVVNLVATWLVLAASVKRAHDRGEGGHLPVLNAALGWVIIVIAILNLQVLRGLGTATVLGWFLVALAFVNAVIGVWLLITLGFLDGTPGANAYGLSPKAARARNYQEPGAK